MVNILRRRSRDNVPMAFAPTWDIDQVFRQLAQWDPFMEMLPAVGNETGSSSTFMPNFEVKETKDTYLFKADVPGVKETDLQISFAGNRLTISGKREDEARTNEDSYFLCETSYGSFTRSFTLPEGVDIDHAQAELRNGQLLLSLPKLSESQAKQIPVRGESGRLEGKANVKKTMGAGQERTQA